MTQQLPNELKIQILQHVDKKTLPIVLRVDSIFHEIGLPILYHTIVLRPFPHRSQSQLLGTASGCLSTIIERPTAAGAVRSMGLDLLNLVHYFNDVQAVDIGAGFFGALKIALPKIMNLQKLEIANLDVVGKICLPPLLRDCRFPTLQHYSGPPEILDKMQSKALKTLFLRSVDNISNVSSTLLAAAQLSGQTLRTLNIQCYTYGAGVDEEWERLHKDIPSLFPNLRHLALESVHVISFVGSNY